MTGRSLWLQRAADCGFSPLAELDPAGYLEGLPDPVIVDEYQRLPGLLPVVKRAVDRRRTAGAFVLTGSGSGALLPRGSETLAGRSHELTFGLNLTVSAAKRRRRPTPGRV